MIIDLIAGARPNFIKLASIINYFKKNKILKNKIEYRVIHTGQHFDENMSGSFFKQLKIPIPDKNLNAGGGSQAEQTAKIMIAYEKLLFEEPSNFTLVVGDVTSTMACSIVAKKMKNKLIHVEAGLRSYDMDMPEEVNRIVTDSISDYFFTTTYESKEILIKNGIDKKNIFFVGNTMIDTLLENEKNFFAPKLWLKNKLKEKKYIILTLHRPSNVDNKKTLHRIINEISINCRDLPIIFPAHPRTAGKLEKKKFKNLIITTPMSYLEFNFLVKKSLGVITDSGGITEETTVMNVPCITIRDNTERPETVSLGTNILIGNSLKNLNKTLDILFSNKWKKGAIPKYWDGKSGERIASHLIDILNNSSQK